LITIKFPKGFPAQGGYRRVGESARLLGLWCLWIAVLRILSVLLVLFFAACSAEINVSDEPPYRAITDTKKFMNWILDPSADVIWGASGWILTEAGEQDLTPTTQEGWDAVRNAAATIAESGNLLMMPGHAMEGDDWLEISAGLTATAELLIDAAERKDSEAIFNLGGTLYNVCVSCHQLYVLPEATQ